MIRITITCPDCKRMAVYFGRGICTCGTYLVKSWKGMNQGMQLVLPWGRRVWIFDKENNPELIQDNNHIPERFRPKPEDRRSTAELRRHWDRY